ncbi:MAG: hypothetical protein U9Q81_12530 [Pseudomonadota bacterium]|nr:hypothetical protein [Pseudomonadota bacterium]
MAQPHALSITDSLPLGYRVIDRVPRTIPVNAGHLGAATGASAPSRVPPVRMAPGARGPATPDLSADRYLDGPDVAR